MERERKMKKNESESCACIVVQDCNPNSRRGRWEDQNIIVGYTMSPRLAQATQGSIVRRRMGKERRKREEKTKTRARKINTVVAIQHPAR